MLFLMWKDCETEFDLLGFDYLVESLKDIVLNDQLSPCSIGIYGDWGSGKSSLVSIALADLQKNNKYLCIKFNGWLFEDYEDAKTALIGSILDKIKEKKKLTAKATGFLKNLYENIDVFKLAGKATKMGLDFFLTGGIGTIAELTLGQVLSKTKNLSIDADESTIEEAYKTIFKNKSEVRDKLKNFQEDFEELLKESKIEKLIVFIDELDRCNHDTILETLEAVRLFLFTKGTAFILGADERQVMYAVRRRFPEVKGNQIDIGKEYLEKMIQYPIKIPQLGKDEVNFYITCLFLQYYFPVVSVNIIDYILEKKNEDFLNFQLTYELINDQFMMKGDDINNLKSAISISKQISSVLSENLNGNPRHCKRFLNSLIMRIKMAKFKNIDLDIRILAKLMLAEYFKDNLFKLIGEMQSVENGMPNELKSIENGDWDKISKLNLWKEDTWFQNWISTEPKLSNIDLRPYFYFSREGLQNISFKLNKSISPEAEQILNQLQSGFDLPVKSALKSSSNISPFEATEILSALISSIEQSSELDYKKIKIIFDWADTKEILIPEVLSFLSRISGLIIKKSMIIRIAAFGKKNEKIQEITEIFQRWNSENSELKIETNKVFK